MHSGLEVVVKSNSREIASLREENQQIKKENAMIRDELKELRQMILNMNQKAN